MKAFLLLALFSLMLNAQAGDKGHGGGGHVCGDSVELYDFYEGRSPLLHGIHVWETDPALSFNDYINKAIARVKGADKELGQYIEKKLNELLAVPYNEIVLPVLIPRTLDADLPLIDESCEFKQVASWNERFGKVYFSRSVFEKMDNKSKAGLYVHETLYKIARDKGDTDNSNAIRKLVALIFSDEELISSEIEKVVVRKEKVGFVPKTGECELSIEATSTNLNDIEYLDLAMGLMFEKYKPVASTALDHPNMFKNKPRIRTEVGKVACEDILKHGIWAHMILTTRKPDTNITVSFKVNGKKVRKDYVVEYPKSRSDWAYFTIEPEKLFPVD